MIAWPRWVRVTDQAGPGGAGVAVDETPIKIAIAEVAGQLACSAGFWRNRVWRPTQARRRELAGQVQRVFNDDSRQTPQRRPGREVIVEVWIGRPAG